ncbi:MAG: CDP-alcohol phosphatidyltransferase family protein [Prevotella sp.]|nr:CDP-alcohol phosphatidyltransferase family protein [Prevotella sp.]MDY4039013.1 CDP-alcohol phosphatidyltransferase family protein [Prevotella sp.]
MNYRDYLQKIIYIFINPIIKGMIKVGMTPNIVTTLGFIGNICATALFIMGALEMQDGNSSLAYQYILWGGIVILFSGLFDMMDGRLARLGNMSSTFGALWDSTLDRYSELISLFGITLIFIENDWFWLGVTTFAAMVGSVMVSYVRARAEGLQIECKVGLMQRPERVVVTAVTAIISGCTENLWWIAGGMILIAVLANITAFWRVEHCYRELKKRE